MAERNGLRLSVVEGGPKIDRIVLGKDGRDAQIEQYKRSLDHMGKLGVRVLCYNFMPQLTDDAAVFRTSFATSERGGALTSSFDLERFDNDRLTEDGTSTDEQVLDYLDYFLKRIIPAAEEAGVLLAMHPDDPPLSPMWNLARIMRSAENYERLFAMHPSPVNGMTFVRDASSKWARTSMRRSVDLLRAFISSTSATSSVVRQTSGKHFPTTGRPT